MDISKMNSDNSFLLNNEGSSLSQSSLPGVNIWKTAGDKPGEKVYRAEWRLLKSLLMQVINPFGEATISFSFKDNNDTELYTGSFKSHKKKFRKLIDSQTLEEYDVIFHAKWLQNTSCELLKNNVQIFCWTNDNKGGGTICQKDTPIADIASKTSGSIAGYKQIDIVAEADNTLLLAFITMVYSY